jgi:hypothetical protein
MSCCKTKQSQLINQRLSWDPWQYPGLWTHVPSRQVTVGPRGQKRGFVAVTGELVVVWTSQFGPQMVDEEDVLWGWYTVTEV